MALALGAALIPGSAAASWRNEEPAGVADVERAKAELARGQSLYDDAHYDEALLAFEAAWQAYPLAEFQYDMGLCHERLGHIEQAIAAFESYLELKPNAADRPNVEHRIGQLRARLPAPPEPAPVIEAVEPPPPRPSSPPPPRTTATPIDDGDDRRAGRGATIAGAITFSLGLGLAVGGGVGFGLPAARRVRTVDHALAPNAPPQDRLTPAQARATAREGDRLLALQLASIGVGAVLVGTGIGLLVAGKRKQRRMQAALAPSRYGAVVMGAVRW